MDNCEILSNTLNFPCASGCLGLLGYLRVGPCRSSVRLHDLNLGNQKHEENIYTRSTGIESTIEGLHNCATNNQRK
eukprot:g35010.t1